MGETSWLSISENAHEYGRDNEQASRKEIIIGERGNQGGQQNEGAAEEKAPAVALCEPEFFFPFLFRQRVFAEIVLWQSVSFFQHAVYVVSLDDMDAEPETKFFRFLGEFVAQEVFFRLFFPAEYGDDPVDVERA